LATEAETSRRARDDADAETEKARQSLKMHAGVTEKLERRIHVLQGDVEARDAEMTRLNDKIAEREAEAVTLQTRLDELAFKHRADLKLAHAQAAKDRAELESEFAIEREEAEEKEQAILARLATHDASIKKVQDACDAKVYAAEDAARDARRAAEAGKIDAEVKLDASLTELAACKSDMLRAVGEAEGLRAALSVMEREYANEVPALRKDLEQCKKDLEHAGVRVGDLKETLERERVERVEVGASLIERDREVRRLLSELERKDLAHANERSKSKASWQKEKLSLIARAKEIAATMEERHRESMRKAKRKIDGANRKVAALSMDKVTLLESTAAGHAEAERREEAAGGSSMSVFEQELAALRGRQDEYDKSVASASGGA
jgi:chromosome segregation ATPase